MHYLGVQRSCPGRHLLFTLLQGSETYRRLAIDEIKQLIRARFENIPPYITSGAHFHVLVEQVEDYIRAVVHFSIPEDADDKSLSKSSGNLYLDAAEETGERLRQEFSDLEIGVILRLTYGYYPNNQTGKAA